MKRYRMIGRPAGAPVDLLVSRTVGEEFDADLDKDLERTLVDSGAVEVVKQRVVEPSKPESDKGSK